MASVTLRRLSKVFAGGIPALHELDLDVRDGELLVLLGPSGSGKTTVLRCIAGLEDPTTGDVVIGDRVVTHAAPAERDVALVFQNPALYPHLSVRENIAFPLEMRGVARAQVARRVVEAATRLGLKDALDRQPEQLSEGERQRAALVEPWSGRHRRFCSTSRSPGSTPSCGSSCAASCSRSIERSAPP